MILETPTTDQLLGLDDTHVEQIDATAALGAVRLHPATARDFLVLRAAAAADGIDLRIVSGHRGFQRQLAIWNAKARGERVLLDAEERVLDALELSPDARVLAILRWSALPGTSRHHWGSDLDVVDAAALAPGSAPSLLAVDYAPGGSQERLARWLERRLDADPASLFFRPYDGVGDGVSGEPWHLSHAPLAALCQAAFDLERLKDVLAASGLELWETVDSALGDLLPRFARVDATRYPPAWRDRLPALGRA